MDKEEPCGWGSKPHGSVSCQLRENWQRVRWVTSSRLTTVSAFFIGVLTGSLELHSSVVVACGRMLRDRGLIVTIAALTLGAFTHRNHLDQTATVDCVGGTIATVDKLSAKVAKKRQFAASFRGSLESTS